MGTLASIKGELFWHSFIFSNIKFPSTKEYWNSQFIIEFTLWLNILPGKKKTNGRLKRCKLYSRRYLKLFSFFNIFLQLCVHTNPIHFKIMYYTFFLIQFIIKKCFMNYIWDLKAHKHVQHEHIVGIWPEHACQRNSSFLWCDRSWEYHCCKSYQLTIGQLKRKWEVIIRELPKAVGDENRSFLDKKLHCSSQMTEKLRRLIFRDTLKDW